MRPLSEQDHYEILEVSRSASRAEIEKAYRLARATFADDSLALYSVVDPRDAEAIRVRIELAWGVLSDAKQREDYDASLAPGGEPAGPAMTVGFDVGPSEVPAAEAPEDLAGELPEGYGGATFRAARLRRALDLDQVAGLTKVNPRYLRYIEEENLEGLPAQVYVRGFVAAFAQVVGLDPKLATPGFMSLYADPVAPPRRARFWSRS